MPLLGNLVTCSSRVVMAMVGVIGMQLNTMKILNLLFQFLMKSM
jgi:hypothetical protein